MPRLVRPALREVRTRVFDSARWAGYQPRPDDILIATYSKCGTTWAQRIVGMLVFASAETQPLSDVSPWPDARFGEPIGTLLAKAEAQTHRRFLKSHLPLSALPLYEDVKYLHVARDGRDACMSLHNHLCNLTPDTLARFNAISRDDPKFGDPYPRGPDDAGAYFHDWITDDTVNGDFGDPAASFFSVENSFWAERRRSNLLLVHYNDLKADRAGEMRRIADFLDADVPGARWPGLVEAASFESMKRDGEALIPLAHMLWEGGPGRFLNKGTNGRWRDVVAKQDLALYEAKVRSEFSPALARWIEHGRSVAGDPRDLPD